MRKVNIKATSIIRIMETKKYPARIAVRAKGTFCVKFPKKHVDSGEFVLGEKVAVCVKKSNQEQEEKKNEFLQRTNDSQ